ncbi:hypothetical protein Tco_1334839 [Tanacetum coccineum]
MQNRFDHSYSDKQDGGSPDGVIDRSCATGLLSTRKVLDNWYFFKSLLLRLVFDILIARFPRLLFLKLWAIPLEMALSSTLKASDTPLICPWGSLVVGSSRLTSTVPGQMAIPLAVGALA